MARNNLAAVLRIESSPKLREGTNPFAFATYLMIGTGILLSTVAFLYSKPGLALLIAAIQCGWPEVTGLCGRSHIGTLTPVHTVSSQIWLKSVGAYTAAGAGTAALVGSVIGLLGGWLDPSQMIFQWAIVALTIVLIAREVGLLSFELPQMRRQTHKMWAFEFGIVPAAAMWGGHIGVTFATVIAHGGVFPLTMMALMLGPAKGAAIFAAYWFGRTIPLWVAPLLTTNSRDGTAVIKLASAPEIAYSLAAVAGMLCTALVAWTLI